MRSIILALLFLMASFSGAAFAADPGLQALTVVDNATGGKTYTVTLQILAMMTALTLLPAALMMMTSFTRIIIVLSILRQAMGTAQTPSNQILVGLALFLTFFIMAPVFDRAYDAAVVPYMAEEMSTTEAFNAAIVPFRDFMMLQTRDNDLTMFAGMSNTGDLDSAEDVPMSILLPAFITSELKTAFQIGFLIFIPFLIIDLVVASVLMSMGMMMLSPMMISLPFKLMLFVLVDGWTLIVSTLAASFFT